MTLDRQTKEGLVERYSRTFAQTQNAFVLDYRGITVPEVTELRAKVREVGGHYEVVKNSLARLAIAKSDMAEMSEHFEGPTAIAYSEGDIVSLARVLRDFAKDVPALEFKGGVVEGVAVAPEEIAQIADLPSRDDLVAKLVFLLQSPIAGFVRSLGAIVPQFVRVLEEIRKKQDAQS